MQKIENNAAHGFAFLRSRMLVNRNTIPAVPSSLQAKTRARRNGTRIIRKLMGNPKGSPETGESAPQM
jgi:hypothetical protein